MRLPGNLASNYFMYSAYHCRNAIVTVVVIKTNQIVYLTNEKKLELVLIIDIINIRFEF